LASFAYKAAKNFQIRINLMVSSTLPAFVSNGNDVNCQINLFTLNIEASIALASCMFEQCTDKFYFGLIAQGVKVSKTVLASAITKLLHMLPI
jgi:hypothetical protein